MRVTFDTNLFGAIAVPERNPHHPDLDLCKKIRQAIEHGTVVPFISEASLTLEALEKTDRIDKVFRGKAKHNRKFQIPQLNAISKEIIEKSLAFGMKVLRVPRIGLPPYLEVPESCYARDEVFTQAGRQARHEAIVGDFPDRGLKPIQLFGAELAELHGFDPSTIVIKRSDFTDYQHFWMDGIVAEYDNPKRYSAPEKLVDKVRNLIAEWFDYDIVCSHYAYGNDLFCTRDAAGASGSNGILSSANRQLLEKNYAIVMVSPAELLGRINCIMNAGA